MLESRRRRLVTLWLGLTLFQLVRLFAHGIDRLHPDPRPFAEPVTVDVNRAPVAVLALLPGIGRGRAEAIVLHRVRHGWFGTVDELAEVDGLGPGTVDALREYVHVAP